MRHPNTVRPPNAEMTAVTRILRSRGLKTNAPTFEKVRMGQRISQWWAIPDCVDALTGEPKGSRWIRYYPMQSRWEVTAEKPGDLP